MPKFFDALRKADGKVALESIKDKFPITSASANLLALKIDELIGSFGSFNSYDLVGIRALPRGKRLYEIAYVTWNASTPALWEGTFYKRNDGWVLMTLSFNTDGIFEKAREYR